MLKLLVADDERILREAVCYLIDWKSIGIELAASCKNGREAYEEACRTKPDIILTDINNGSVHHQGWTLWKSSRSRAGCWSSSC